MLLAGRVLLVFALALAVYGVGASLLSARGPLRRRRGFADSSRRAVYALAATLALCFAILELAFLRDDFSFALVAGHSSTTTPVFYRATAIWSSQEGSLLLWVLLLSLWTTLVVWRTQRTARELLPWATAVLLGLAAFFCFLLVVLVSPFDRASPAPVEGLGLNPLLRHPSMMIHPPMLYSGYTLFAVPFAFGVAALVTGRLNTDWIRRTRPFALAAWLLLGTGIVLGARWSYSELGWGGYWAWDAVENASLMPWLTGTAFLHSVMIQERRGMLKVWNVSLVLATGILAVLGTFLVRSGILNSIHAFGASTLGGPFVTLIAIMALGSAALVVWRAPQLRSEHRLDSLLSREALFLGNNLVLVALCFVILWGTFFPLLSEAVTGDQASVGPPWFDRYVAPLALVLVLLSGIGPLAPWRRATASALWRGLRLPMAVALGTLAGLVLAGGIARRPGALAMFCLGAFVLAAVAQELWRGTRARQALTGEPPGRAAVALVGRNRRRYGGYLVHAGIAVLFCGIAASSTFQQARDVRLQPGGSARVGDYDVTYVRPTGRIDTSGNGRLAAISLGADVRVRRNGREPLLLHTERRYFPSSSPRLGALSRYFQGEATSEVGLRAGLRRDVWVVVSPDITRLLDIVRRGDEVFRLTQALPREQRAAALGEALRRLVALHRDAGSPGTFRVLVSPLVSWIWLGALVVVCGGLLALSPAGAAQRVARARPATRLAGELGHPRRAGKRPAVGD